MTQDIAPENRTIEKLQQDIAMRDARISALRRERMEMLFPRIESLEEQVKLLEEQVALLRGHHDVLLEALRQTKEQLDQVVGMVGVVIDVETT